MLKKKYKLQIFVKEEKKNITGLCGIILKSKIIFSKLINYIHYFFLFF